MREGHGHTRAHPVQAHEDDKGLRLFYERMRVLGLLSLEERRFRGLDNLQRYLPLSDMGTNSSVNCTLF